jgi:hypothetical protein
MSLLLFPTRNILIKEEKRIMLKKSRRASRLKILQVFLYNVCCPPMMNQSAQRNTIPSSLSISGSHAF